MAGKNSFTISPDEKEILKKIEETSKTIKINQPKSDPLKKYRELFHFISYYGAQKVNAKQLYLPEDGSGADIEITSQQKLAIEITECFGDKKAYKNFRITLDSLINNKPINKNNRYKNIDNFSGNLRKKFIYDLNSKNNKIERYKKEGFSTELLIVCYEAYDNCSVTGSWVIKVLNDCIDNISNFDKVHILVYDSSPKDGRPRIFSFPEDMKN